MNMKTFTLFAVGLLFSLSGFAQGRILGSLEANPDVRSAGMGHVLLGNTDQMHLYSNPAALIFSRQKVSADLGTEIYPDSEVGRLAQFNFGGSFKFHPHRAFLVGLRRQGGLSLPTTAGKGDLKPYEFTADLGYAFAVTSDVVVYASGSYVRSYVGTTAQGLSFSVGVGYQKEVTLAGHPSLLTLGLRLLDAGKAVKFGHTKLPHSLPTSIVTGGDWAMTLAHRHRLTYALSARAFTPKGGRELHIGTGLEYTYNRLVSARLGYQFADKGADRLTLGAGVQYDKFRLNAAYSHSPAQHGVDTFLLGIGLTL